MSNEVKFIDTSKEVKAEMVNLSKGALRSSAKVIRKILRDTVPVRTGAFKKAIASWVKIDKRTGQPSVEVGYYSRAQTKKKYGIKFFANPAWFEFGTRPHVIQIKSAKTLTDGHTDYGKSVYNRGMSGKNFLRNSVYNNIDEIKKAQEEHLGRLTEILISQGVNIDYEDVIEDD